MKLRISVIDSSGRENMAEFLAKDGEWCDAVRDGSIIVATGKLTGKVNDRGYLNMGLFAFDVTVISSAPRAAPSRQPPPQQQQRQQQRQEPRRQAQPAREEPPWEEDANDIPF